MINDKLLRFMSKMDKYSKIESIDVAGRTITFGNTKAGRLHNQFKEKIASGDFTSLDEEFMSSYFQAVENSIVVNMKIYAVLQQLVEDMLLHSMMASSGKIIGVTFPDQVKVLQKHTDKILIFIGKKINYETEEAHQDLPDSNRE